MEPLPVAELSAVSLKAPFPFPGNLAPDTRYLLFRPLKPDAWHLSFWSLTPDTWHLTPALLAPAIVFNNIQASFLHFLKLLLYRPGKACATTTPNPCLSRRGASPALPFLPEDVKKNEL
jgi:hypothetical protein